jgi:hypothetical protein
MDVMFIQIYPRVNQTARFSTISVTDAGDMLRPKYIPHPTTYSNSSLDYICSEQD